MKVVHFAIAATMILALVGCADPKLPTASSKLLNPNGGFTLFVSNQSFAIDPVDVRVEIDGELAVSDYFRVGTQHTYVPFQLSLPEGKHHIRIWSTKGGTQLEKEFDIKDQYVGVVTYWYYPRSHYSPTPRRFEFRTQNGPLTIM
jgi:hypothetical protein